MPKLETRLRREDFQKVEMLAQMEGITGSEFVREAVLIYIDQKLGKLLQEKDEEIARAIDSLTSRICAMLNRQGRQLGTLFEITRQTMSQTNEGSQLFESATTRAGEKLRGKLTSEERDFLERVRRELRQ